jgi:uncharacterized protein (TIGR04551 family)
MPRLLAAALVVVSLALSGAARAQEPKAPGPAPSAAAPETDPKVQAAIQAAVEKAKEELRNELRAEMQGQQSASEFMGTVADQNQPKIQLLDLDGYFRVRAALLNKLNLTNRTDASGYNYFPKPLRAGSSISTANLRLRLEPTINASETVRVHMQIDVLDNYVLGSNASKGTDSTGSPYPIPFYGSTRTYTQGDTTTDRPLIIPRRVWGEVQTPVGLLSFGRMPSQWGLGIMANAGTGLDQDFGDTVDRIQFAIPPVSTPVGSIVFVPMLDFDIAGPLYADPHGKLGSGQPLEADSGSHGRTLAVKILRMDSDEELRRKLERGERSFNYGLYYNHRTQTYTYPTWIDQGFSDPGFTPGSTTAPTFKKRSAAAHMASLWGRWLGGNLRLEGELVGIYGTIGNANASALDDTGQPLALASQKIHMKQFGLVLQSEYKYTSKLTLGFELGMASGDSAPGFGNDPDRVAVTSELPPYGSIEGPQWSTTDHSINNFRFNPAYHVDLIFYRRILGQVTDATYLRPSSRWNIMPGLTLDTSILYAQAQCASSTPSARANEQGGLDAAHKGSKPLALELDNKLTLSPTRGFTGWVDLGLLKPLGGMDAGSGFAWMIDFGLAARF